MSHAEHLNTITNSKGHKIVTGIARQKTVLISIHRTNGKQCALVLSYKSFKKFYERVNEIWEEFNE